MRVKAGLLLLTWCLPTPALADEWFARSTVEMDFRAWNDNLGDDSSQAVTIVSSAVNSENWRFGISSGYVLSEVDSPLPQYRGSIATPLDTVISASFRGLRTNVSGLPLQVSIDGDLSLPTGTASLSASEMNTIFDPLLARQSAYGAGLNYSAGMSASLQMSSKLAIGLGARRTRLGAFAPESAQPAIEIDPGDLTSIFSQVTWKSGRTAVTAGVKTSWESVSTRSGQPFFQRGRGLEISGFAAIPLSTKWRMSGGGNYTFNALDRRADLTTGSLAQDLAQANGDVWSVSGSLARRLGHNAELSLEADYVNSGASELPDSDFSYLPARTRWRAGIVARQSPSRSSVLSAALRYMDYVDKGSRLLRPLTADGLNATLSLTFAW